MTALNGKYERRNQRCNLNANRAVKAKIEKIKRSKRRNRKPKNKKKRNMGI
jgi:hypothetical protein